MVIPIYRVKANLGLSKIFVHSKAKAFLHALVSHPCIAAPSICIAHTVAIRLHDEYAIYDIRPPSEPLVFAIHHTVLAVAISCKGELLLGRYMPQGDMGSRFEKSLQGVTAASSGTHTRCGGKSRCPAWRPLARPSAGCGGYRRGAAEIPVGSPWR